MKQITSFLKLISILLFFGSCNNDLIENTNEDIQSITRLDTMMIKNFVDQELKILGKEEFTIKWEEMSLVGRHIEVPFRYKNKYIAPTYKNSGLVGNYFLIIDNFINPSKIFIGSVVSANKIKYPLKIMDINKAKEIAFCGDFYLFNFELVPTYKITFENGQISKTGKIKANNDVSLRNGNCEPYLEYVETYDYVWVYEAGEWYQTAQITSAPVWVYPGCDEEDDLCVLQPWLCNDDPCLLYPELCNNDPCLLYPWMCDPCIQNPYVCNPCIQNPELCEEEKECFPCTTTFQEHEITTRTNYYSVGFGSAFLYTWKYNISNINCKTGAYAGNFFHVITSSGFVFSPCAFEGTEVASEMSNLPMTAYCSSSNKMETVGYSLTVKFEISMELKCDISFVDIGSLPFYYNDNRLFLL